MLKRACEVCEYCVVCEVGRRGGCLPSKRVCGFGERASLGEGTRTHAS